MEFENESIYSMLNSYVLGANFVVIRLVSGFN